MKVSFIIIALNAEKYIETSLKCLQEQNYNHKDIEVILVDSNSTDRTKEIMSEFKNKNEKYFDTIKVLDNPKKTLPCGWNVALKEVTGEAVLRVDAHSKFEKKFISQNVKELNNGENIVGGHRISIADNENRWQKLLLVAEESLFGSGVAKYRRDNKKEYVKTLAHAMYRKEVFDKVGKYNESLARTEDNEMHYRMSKAGYKFLLSPDIVSYHCARNSLKGMIKQKYGNGKWIGITMYYCPKCFSIYHFVPFLFVMAIIISTIIACCEMPLFIELLGIAYAMFNLLNLVVISINNGFHIEYLLLPLIFGGLHISYGVGTIVGLVKGFWYKKKNEK